MADSKDKKKPQKPQKPGFQIPQLSETQWGMLGCAVFFIGYILYGMIPTGGVDAPDMSGMSAPVQHVTAAESEEERFKRENKNTTLPTGSAVPANIVAEQTQITQQVPFGDEEMEFRLRLPSSWVMSEFARYGLPGEENYAILTNIARYFGPAIEDARPYLWIEVERIKRYTTAETWARAYMIKRGISVQAMDVKSTTNIQALYVDVKDARSYAVRSLFRIEGDMMVLVSMGVPIADYKRYKDMLGLCLNSFTLLHPIPREIEKIEETKLLNVLKFKHYLSWAPKNLFADSTLRPSVELHNPQETSNPKGDLLQGIIMVNTWRKSSQFKQETAMQEIRDRLQELRMTIKDPESVKDLPLFSNFTSVKQEEYQALVNTYLKQDQFDIIKSEESKTRQAVYVTILDNGYYQTYITMVSPLRDMNYVIWAQNMEQYNLTLRSLEVRGPPTEEE